MKYATILCLVFLSFSNLAQNPPITEISFDLGIKLSYMSKNSKDGYYPCTGQQCYHHYNLERTSTVENQGYIQFSYRRNRIFLPFGIGYKRREEKLFGNMDEGIKLFGTTYYEHTQLYYSNYSDYGNVFTGFGFNILKKDREDFIGPIIKLNYSVLTGKNRVVTADTSLTTTNGTPYTGNATDYLNESESLKNTLTTSLGFMSRFNVGSRIRINVEGGYQWSNQNSISLGRIVPISGGLYMQVSFGYNLKKSKKSDSTD